MKHYSPERKEAVLRKLMPPESVPLQTLAKQERISRGSLYNWVRQARLEGKLVPDKRPKASKWSAEARFTVVVETATLSQEELSQYCREKGLYPEQVKSWKQDCIRGAGAAPKQAKAEKAELQKERKRSKALERELRRKEKALAEAAALLVLRKKADAIWGDSEDE